ncbi:MAG: M55 family metallopeptidase [Acetobacteraceae bacterium]|nr:M55 family metallopeptidase [Acetobacteraceae bacterium]
MGSLRVYVSADMEGVAGVVSPRQAGVEGDEYRAACALMVGEVNAAVEAALQAGASLVVVNDGHGNMRNLAPAALHKEARLISGEFKPLSMMEGVGGGFDAALLIGYHSRAGSPGVIDHTYSGRTVLDVKLNGRPVGETGINAGVAGFFGVPVVMVSGDSVVAAEARELLGPVETAVVKEPAGRLAASSLSPARAQEEIRAAVARALSPGGALGRVKPLVFPAPVTVEVSFMTTAMADSACLIPGVEAVAPRQVRFTGGDYLTAFRCLRAMITLAYVTIPS